MRTYSAKIRRYNFMGDTGFIINGQLGGSAKSWGTGTCGETISECIKDLEDYYLRYFEVIRASHIEYPPANECLP